MLFGDGMLEQPVPRENDKIGGVRIARNFNHFHFSLHSFSSSARQEIKHSGTPNVDFAGSVRRGKNHLPRPINKDQSIGTIE